MTQRTDYSFDPPSGCSVVIGKQVVALHFDSPFWPGFSDISSETRQEEWARLVYDHCDVCLLCYGVNEDRFTFDVWIPKHYEWVQRGRAKPCVLVATKCEKGHPRTVTEEEGKRLADKLGIKYFEGTKKTKPKNAILKYETTVCAKTNSPEIKEAFLEVLSKVEPGRAASNNKKCTIQ
jgi:GTPase SAR1 family protein